MKSKNWNDLIKPVVVLVVICILTSAALAGANSVTAPIIEAANAEAARQAYLAVLPDADNFEPVSYTTEGVSAAMKATNGAGWVIQAAAKGYGGDVPVVVSFNDQGEILGIKYLANSESAGFGSKLADGSEAGLNFAQQFVGKSGPQTLRKTVDGIAGATISSKAAIKAVNNAVACFEEISAAE